MVLMRRAAIIAALMLSAVPFASAGAAQAGSPPKLFVCPFPVSCKYQRIQDAISAAPNNAIIIIAGGRYYENPVIDTGYTMPDTTSLILRAAGNVVVDGSGGGNSVFSIGSSGHPFHVEIWGIAITGGAAYQGGGIRSTDSTVLLGTHTSVAKNQADSAGGGVWTQNGTLTLNSATVHDNSLPGGGSGAGIYGSGTPITLEANSSVYANSISGGSGSGGGIDSSGGSVQVFSTSTVHDNTITASAGSGGGMYVSGASVTLDSGSSIYRNHITASAASGGGLFVSGGDIYLRDSTSVHHNVLTAGSASGSGIFESGGHVMMTSSSQVYANVPSNTQCFGC